MALKKSELYSSLWQSCDELRGGMDASQYKDAIQNSVKVTVDSLRLPTFQNFELVMPPNIEEQSAIAVILSDMDAEVAALEAKLAKARSINQSMMEELLTGRIRLPVGGRQTAEQTSSPDPRLW